MLLPLQNKKTQGKQRLSEEKNRNMPNRNYIKGRKKEYKLVNVEKSQGNIAFRSAGSHSPIDVISIDIENKKIKFIQSKPDNWTESQIKKLLGQNDFFNGTYDVEFIVA